MDEVELTKAWDAVKGTFEDVEPDVLKSLVGNNAAAARSRKGLRQLKRDVSALIKALQAATNAIKAARKAEKTAE